MNLNATILLGTGTSDGARKGWETRRSGGASPAQAFISPNQRTSTLEDALKGLHSKTHAAFVATAKELMARVAPGGSVVDAIGSWRDGAEDAIVISSKGTYAQARYMGAKMGMLGNQKGVIAFHQKTGGSDTMWRVVAGKNYTLEQIGATLDRHGINDRSLIPRGDGTEIRIFDQGSKMSAVVKGLANEYDTQIYKKAGQGGYIGGGTREEGSEAFQKVIDSYENSGGLRAAGDRRDSGWQHRGNHLGATSCFREVSFNLLTNLYATGVLE